jgi:hypothetical protein
MASARDDEVHALKVSGTPLQCGVQMRTGEIHEGADFQCDEATGRPERSERFLPGDGEVGHTGYAVNVACLDGVNR